MKCRYPLKVSIIQAMDPFFVSITNMFFVGGQPTKNLKNPRFFFPVPKMNCSLCVM